MLVIYAHRELSIAQCEPCERRGGGGKQQKVAAVGPDGFKPPAPINTGRSGLTAARPPALHVPELGLAGGGGLPDTPLSPNETPRSRTARQSTQVSMMPVLQRRTLQKRWP